MLLEDDEGFGEPARVDTGPGEQLQRDRVGLVFLGGREAVSDQPEGLPVCR